MKLIREGGNVRRWHTCPTISTQTVAAHSWGVAMLVRYITHPDALTTTLLLHALEHDLAEVQTGDIPYCAKVQFPDLKAASLAAEATINSNLDIMTVPLSPTEETIIKVCDMLELMQFALEERMLGNRNMDTPFRIGESAVRILLLKLPDHERKAASFVLTNVIGEYNECK